MTDEANEGRRAVVARLLGIEPFFSLSSAVELDVAAVSVRGKLRPHNTDHYLALRFDRGQETLLTSLQAADLPPAFREYGFALVVADGAGSEEAGDRASRLALSALAYQTIRHAKWNLRVDAGTSGDVLKEMAFFARRANDALREATRIDARLPGLTTSLAGVFIAGAHLFFASVGHSTTFLLQKDVLIELSTHRRVEHSTGRRKQSFPETHIGRRPIGQDVHVEHVQLSPDDRVLLCTNGLTDAVSDNEIVDTLTPGHNPAEDCQRLVDLALAGGSTDDVTVMLADYRVGSSPP